MKRTLQWIGAWSIACACAAVTPGAARSGAAAAAADARRGDVPERRRRGAEERDFIQQSMKDYSIALAFSRAGSPRPDYVASVAITIKDGHGNTVFESPSAGPYLLVRLPAGRYSVVASYHDVTQTRPVTATRSASTVTTFVWSS